MQGSTHRRSASLASDDVRAPLLSSDEQAPAADTTNARCSSSHSADGGGICVPLEAAQSSTSAAAADVVPPPLPVALTWSDVGYQVNETHGRYLLRAISGAVRSGEMLAIIGPSGAGKTTLLDVLALRKTQGKVHGNVYLNGMPAEVGVLQRVSGYVQQEDRMLSYTTVEEVIRFSGKLRSTPEVSDEAVAQRTEHVMRLLRIEHLRDRLIGGSEARGISGGERKRVAVAVELVTAPSVLFLDEPTTGLDTFSALHLLHVLRDLAATGMTLIFSIHQPRAQIFYLLDRVLLLNAAGEEAFVGPAAAAPLFLEALHIRPTISENPADFLIDAVSEVQPDALELLQRGGVSTDGMAVPPPTQGRDIAAAFRATRLPEVQREVRELRAALAAADEVLPALPAGAFFRSATTQIRVVAQRGLLNKLRDPIATVVSVSVALVFAVLIGSVYYRVGHSQASVRSRMGVLFFILMNTTFSSLGSLSLFLSERAIAARERRNGMYRASAYYLGKISQDVPFGLLVNFIFSAIVYPMVGLQPDLRHFGVFAAVCSLVLLSGYAICLFLSSLSRDYAVANMLASLVLVLYLLPTGGMLVSLDSIPFMWRWLKYVSFARYGFAALVANELCGLELTCEDRAPYLPCITSGTVYAELQGFRCDDLVKDVEVVALNVVVYLVLGYWSFRCLRSNEGT